MNDVVNHPQHYTDGKYEVIDFIEEKDLGFHLGNTVKYICRAGKKDPDKKIEDLKKALWYLRRYKDRKRAGECKKDDTITVSCTSGYLTSATVIGNVCCNAKEKLPIDIVDFCVDKKLDYFLSNCIADIVKKDLIKAEIALISEIDYQEEKQNEDH